MKKELKGLLLICCICIAPYLLSVLFHSVFWSDILSPVCSFLATVVIFNSYRKMVHGKSSVIWLLYAFSSLGWFIADFLWVENELILHKDPGSDTVIYILNLISTALIFAAVIFHIMLKCNRWSGIQLIIDSITISVSVLWMSWLFFFDKQMSKMILTLQYNIINTTSILLDVTIIICTFIWYVSIRQGKTPAFLHILSASLFVFLLNDIYYYNLIICNYYVPSTTIHFFYITAFIGIAFASKVRQSATDLSLIDYNKADTDYKHKWYLLLFAPTFILIFKGFNLTEFLFYLFVIFVYEGIRVYIQASIKNQNLLKRELTLNDELEQRISERTGELSKRTAELEEINRQLDYLSCQDVLTGLYNRRYFFNVLEQGIPLLEANETIAIIFIDIDRFKTINDTYGHQTGDQLLKVMAERFNNFSSKPAILARLGGDEFVFCYLGSYDYKSALDIANNLIKECTSPIQAGRYTFRITLSAGISICPADAPDANTLLKNADIAMYQAKKLGFNKCVAFNDEANGLILKKHRLELLLKKADYDREFMLYYQPQFSIPDKRFIGMEALIRWNNPECGFVSPAEFIPVAEEADLIVPIGSWVTKEAVRQIGVWNRKYSANLKMGINVSPKQLDQTDFIEQFKSVMELNSVNPSWIDFEITEGVAMEGNYKINQISKQFKGTGISISIDDFGTGYSSLSYLKKFPFNRIKIAKELIDSITNDEYDKQIVKAVVMLANALNIQTIAEGVEQKEQLDLLVELGCGQIQGYYYGRPMPPSEFEAAFLSGFSEKAEGNTVCSMFLINSQSEI